MHEVSIIDEVIQTVLLETDKYPDSKVESVSLKIGKLRQFVPDIMKFCYQVATQETPLEGSKLILEEIPIRVECPICNQITDVQEYDFCCPKCLSVDVKVISGNDLILESIQLSDDKIQTRE